MSDMDWQEQNRADAFSVIEEENNRLNDYSPVKDKKDLIKRLEDIALQFQDLSFQDQKDTNQNWSRYQYDVLDIMNSIQYIKENLHEV